jgi:thymidylate synthase (FAD)
MNEAKLISVTPNAESIMAYCARVSSNNQDNPEYEKLLSYCVKHKHWSVFEMADMCVEIVTSRAMAQQILRHRSFHFQEFSQRYANAATYVPCEAREQDTKNRQNSTDTLSEDIKATWLTVQAANWNAAIDAYKWALDNGIAKETARMILPVQTETKLYMKGTVRDWIHYIAVRTDPSTQREHRDVAESIKTIFIEQFPTVGKVAFN